MDYRNNYNNNNYVYQDNNLQKKSSFGETACVIGLCAAILTIFCDPIYLISIFAFVFSLIGVIMGQKNRGLGIAGLVVSILGLIWQIVMDIIIYILWGTITLGVGLILPFPFLI